MPGGRKKVGDCMQAARAWRSISELLHVENALVQLIIPSGVLLFGLVASGARQFYLGRLHAFRKARAFWGACIWANLL